MRASKRKAADSAGISGVATPWTSEWVEGGERDKEMENDSNETSNEAEGAGDTEGQR